MLLFKRIFDFKKEEVRQLEQRMSSRHVPGKAFPLGVRLRYLDGEWPARLVNISAGGLALEIDGAAPDPVGLAANVLLRLESHLLDLRAAVTHSHRSGHDWMCGLSVGQLDFNDRKAYLQLLQPIAIGTSMKPLPDDRVQQNEPQFVKQVFTGESDSVLSVWLAKRFGTPLHSFEFRMSDYFVRADAATRVLEVFLREEMDDTSRGRFTTPVFDTTGGRNDEIRRLFRWVVLNLPESISGDIREFLREMAR